MFLNAILLWGAALGAVPVIIHLLNKRRFRPVRWAAMEFLLQAIRQNSRRLQIRDLILMLVRTAAIVFLALALARPTLSGRAGLLGGRSTTAAVLLIDNSFSMGYHNGRETRFEVAKRLAKLILSELEKGTWCAVYTFNDDVRSPLGDPSQRLDFVEQEIDRSIFISDGATNVEKALSKAQKLFQTRPDFKAAAKEVYILTDRQAKAWDPRSVSVDFPRLLQELSQEATLFLVDAGDAGGENAALIDLASEDTLVSAGDTVHFTAVVKNFGQSPIEGLLVEFLVDPSSANDTRSVARIPVDIRAGEIASVKFEAKFSTGGDHKVEARLGADRLEADNRRFLTVEVIDEVRFLLVDGRDPKPDDHTASEAWFLKTALSPVDYDHPGRKPVVAGEIIPHYRLSEKNLADYQAVALCNVEKLHPKDIEQLKRQVSAGMGLLVFLGDQTDPALFKAMLGEGGAKLLPAEVLEPWGEVPKIGDAKVPVHRVLAGATEHVAHPIMADFNSEDAREILPQVKIYRAFGLQPLPSDDVRVVAAYEGGEPAIVERRVGLGSVLLFGFPATTAWGNLPTQPAFVMLAKPAALWLTRGYRPSKNLLAGAPLRGYVSLADQKAALRVTAPPPVSRRETHSEPTPDGRAAFEFGDTERAGFYDVALERPGFQPLAFSLNPNAKEESNLNTVSLERLKLDYSGVEFVYVAKSDDLRTKLASEKRGTEIWPWLLGLVFAMLVAESILANLWAPRD